MFRTEGERTLPASSLLTRSDRAWTELTDKELIDEVIQGSSSKSGKEEVKAVDKRGENWSDKWGMILSLMLFGEGHGGATTDLADVEETGRARQLLMNESSKEDNKVELLRQLLDKVISSGIKEGKASM